MSCHGEVSEVKECNVITSLQNIFHCNVKSHISEMENAMMMFMMMMMMVKIR